MIRNLAKMDSATTGTGTLTLGSAVTGFLSFAAAGVLDGEEVEYCIRDGADSEIGLGTYTSSGTTLSRDVVYNSTNSGAKISCTGNQNVIVTPPARHLNAIDPYGLHHRLSGFHADDDEFETNTSGDWTQVTPAGTANWVWGNHCATVQIQSQGGSDAACILKAITLADGDWIETSVRAIVQKLQNFTMFGLVIADGVLATSNGMTLTAYQDNSVGSLNIRFDRGTLTNLATPLSTVQLDSTSMTGALRLKLLRVSSTAYGWWVAPEGGVPFFNWTSANQDPGFTPAYAGVFASTWGGSNRSIVAFDYFRHMS